MAFPPVKTFIVHRSNWYSRTGTVSLLAGTLFSSEYPLSNLIDGLNGPMTRFSTTTIKVRIALTGEENTNIVGIFNHNLDPGLLIQPYVDGVALSRTFSVQYPNCWIDLRGFNAPDATGLPLTTVDLQISGNSRPIAISEIAVAGAYLFDGTIEAPYAYDLQAKTNRRRTVTGALMEAGSGAMGRHLRLALQVNQTDAGLLQNIWTDVGEHGEFVLVAPTSRANDIWMVRWPQQRSFTYGRSGQVIKVPLDLVEEPGGVLV